MSNWGLGTPMGPPVGARISDKKVIFRAVKVKGTVHPKIKILSSFTHPQVVPNLYEVICSAEQNIRKIFWRKFVTRLFWGTIDFHSRNKNGSQWCPRTALFPTFFKISSFVFSRTKTFIQVWNYLRVSKWWQNLHFWVNYPFNMLTKDINKMFNMALTIQSWILLHASF